MDILDQSGDTNFRELHRYVRLYPFPDFVKKADLQSVTGSEEKSARAFADVRTSQFPIHNRPATFVSYVYFLEKQSEINPKARGYINQRLDEAAEYWGIKNAVTALRSKHASLHQDLESQLPDSSYAIVWASDDGRKERRYPLRNALEVKAAASWYEANLPEIRKQFTFTDRQTIAAKILQKAAEHGAAVADHQEALDQSAGRGFCDPKQASCMIKDRIKIARRVKPEVADQMTKLAAAVEAMPRLFLEPGRMSQLAETVDQFDRCHGLTTKYSEHIPNPESVLFAATYTKTAAFSKEACETLTGSVYTQDDFSKLALSDVRGLFGDEIADAVCVGLKIDPEKMAEVAATFPRPEAQMLDDLMSDNGVDPLAKQASAYPGFSFDQLQQIADAV